MSTYTNYKDELNDEIRHAKKQIAQAALAGVRGDEMLKLKLRLVHLKAVYRGAFRQNSRA